MASDILSVGADVAKQAVAANAHDSTFVGLLWVIAILIAMLVIAVPLIELSKRIRSDSKEANKDKAEKSLYSMMEEQLARAQSIADQAFSEKDALILRVGALEAKGSRADDLEALVLRLKDKLDSKDEELRTALKDAAEDRKVHAAAQQRFLDILAEKERGIADRDNRNAQLEARVLELELHAQRTEWLSSRPLCPMADTGVAT